MAPMPVYAPAGGVNFISTRSLSEAIAAALLRGDSGKAYLVGDENWTFAEYLSVFFETVGKPQDVPALDQEHPLLPDSMLYAGRGTLFYYEPYAKEQALPGDRRHAVKYAIVAAVRQAQRMSGAGRAAERREGKGCVRTCK